MCAAKPSSGLSILKEERKDGRKEKGKRETEGERDGGREEKRKREEKEESPRERGICPNSQHYGGQHWKITGLSTAWVV